MTAIPGEFAPPARLLPAFIAMMEEVKALLRFVFATGNTLTFPVSGTGSAGMEACIVNLVEPGDAVVVGVNGVFGTRMADVIERAGGVAVRVEAPWGRIVRAEQIEAALRNCGRPKLVALVHAETSTGAWQPLADAARLAHEHGALFLADCVTSLGGEEERAVLVCQAGRVGERLPGAGRGLGVDERDQLRPAAVLEGGFDLLGPHDVTPGHRSTGARSACTITRRPSR